MISIIFTTEENKKLCQITGIPEIQGYRDTGIPLQRVPQGAFTDEVTTDIDGFTDEPVV